jgi:anti-sigma regulatory factor (Ser/Thr protein kinase)
MSSGEQPGLAASYEPGANLCVAAARSGPSLDGRRREWRLHSVESAVPRIRHELRAFLEDTGLSTDERDDLVLAACEAVTNAVDHAQSPTEPFFDACIEVADGVVTIVVRDHGQWREPTSMGDRGRGLAMMRVLADTTVTLGPQGTTVTLRSCGTGARVGAGAEPLDGGMGRAS